MLLSQVPFEIISQTYSHILTAQDVLHLSQTCRSLHEFTRKEGWRIFVRCRFPSLPIKPSGLEDYAEAAHGLTTLSRNWDRRAFVARFMEPEGNIYKFPGPSSTKVQAQWDRPTGQTMGYRPSIDSYQRWIGSRWGSRMDIVSWSTGAELVLKKYNEDLKVPEYFIWKTPGAREGWDDVTCLKLLRPDQKHDLDMESEYVVFGTAGGDLSLIRMNTSDHEARRTQSYVTNDQIVRALDVSSSNSPLIAASVSNYLVLYAIGSEMGSGLTASFSPVSQVKAVEDHNQLCCAWSTQFLSESRLAVGLGPLMSPLHIYEVTPSGLSDEPIRKFSMKSALQTTRSDDENGAVSKALCSVYPIVPLPEGSSGSSSPGNVFLSGWYDGTVRLHDLRSPSQYEFIYRDATDDSPIFSLQTLGRERIAAGAGRHGIVKFWDIRVSGGRCYDYTQAMIPPATTKTPTRFHTTPTRYRNPKSPGWNLFLFPRNMHQIRARHAATAVRNNARAADSPVYTISSPAATSPSLYMGVENNIIQMDFVSILDPYPDPVYEPYIVRRGGRGGRGATDNKNHHTSASASTSTSTKFSRPARKAEIHIKETWNPYRDALDLSMYEQARDEGEVVKLKSQRGVAPLYDGLPGYDERWTD